jgi:Alginate lyase
MELSKVKKTATVYAAALLWICGCQADKQPVTAPAQPTVTDGWIEKKVTFEVQFPYDLKVNDRYSFDAATNTHDLWVNFTDKPHAPPPNHTNPRTEIRFMDTYTTGQHMFDADVCVRPGTHAAIMQVFGAAKRATAFMLDAQPDGTITYYDVVDEGSFAIKQNANNVWWNLKVAHDPAARDGLGEIKVYVNNVLTATVAGHGLNDHYFKCGVYSRDNSGRSEVLYRNIRYWVK